MSTSHQVWSPRELDILYSNFGGTASMEQTAEQTADITLTTPDGDTYTTEWEIADHPEHGRLPVIQSIYWGGPLPTVLA